MTTFTVNANQKYLLEVTACFFIRCANLHNSITTDGAHGRLETRKIFIITELNGFLKFPHVRKAFMAERSTYRRK